MIADGARVRCNNPGDNLHGACGIALDCFTPDYPNAVPLIRVAFDNGARCAYAERLLIKVARAEQ